MKTYCLLIMSFAVILQGNQVYASDLERPPLHPGLTIVEQDQQKTFQDEYDDAMEKIALCSVRQSLRQARTLQIVTNFSEDESMLLSQTYKEPVLGEKSVQEQSFYDRAWHKATHSDHKKIEHPNALSPQAQENCHKDRFKMKLDVENFKDEDL